MNSLLPKRASDRIVILLSLAATLVSLAFSWAGLSNQLNQLRSDEVMQDHRLAAIEIYMMKRDKGFVPAIEGAGSESAKAGKGQ